MSVKAIREILEMAVAEETVFNLQVSKKKDAPKGSYAAECQNPDQICAEYFATFERFEGKKRARFWLSNNRCTILDLDQIISVQAVPPHEIAELIRISEFVIGNDLQSAHKKVVGEILEFLNKIRELAQK